MRVFLSYRRTDDRHLAGRLRDVLAIEVGDDNVFFDVDSITAGQDFRVAIRDYIDGIDVMIALIGPRWDSSRLAVTTDPVRMELAEAFRRAKPVIPVLIEDTPMPSPGELPHELEQLSFLNALVVRPDPDFRGDAARVARAAHLAHERGTVEREQGLVGQREREVQAETERERASAEALTAQQSMLATQVEAERARAQQAQAEQARRQAEEEAARATAQQLREEREVAEHRVSTGADDIGVETAAAVAATLAPHPAPSPSLPRSDQELPPVVSGSVPSREILTEPRPVPDAAGDEPGAVGRSRRAVWLIIGAVALVVVVVGAALIARSGQNDTPESTQPDRTSTPSAPATYAATTQCATAAIPIDIEVTGTDLWVTSSQTGTLQRCDTTLPSSQPDTFVIGSEPASGEYTGQEIVSTPGSLYVTQAAFGTVARVDLADMSVESIPVEGSPLGGAVLGETVWVNTYVADDAAFPGRLIPIDGGIAGTAIKVPYHPGYMRSIGGQLWVTYPYDHKIGRIDPTTGPVVEFDVPGEPFDILPIGDEHWVTLRAANQVAVIDPGTGEIVDRIDVGSRPHMLVEAFGSVWVSNAGDDAVTPGSVSRIDPGTRVNVQPPIEVGLGPVALAVGEDRLYVANYHSALVSVLAPS